ncbi:MAG: hypothetical protein IT463_13465 [Planctomycetes bacterium]|nr:hypothetical protein [Planctomycetota bacterium]
MHNQLGCLSVATPAKGRYRPSSSSDTVRIMMNAWTSSGSYELVETAFDTVAPDNTIPKHVYEFLNQFPTVKAEYARIKEMLRQTFEGAYLRFEITRPDHDEDPQPLLSVFVDYRDSREAASRKRRALMNGPWLNLSGQTLSRVALHLGQHVE